MEDLGRNRFSCFQFSFITSGVLASLITEVYASGAKIACRGHKCCDD